MENRSFIVAISALAVTLVLVALVAARGVPTVVRTNLENLPLQIGHYTGKEDFFSQEVYDVLQADRHVYRHYQSPQGDQVDLYIGYYGTAKGGRTGHNPFACLPGAGWGIVEKGTVLLKPSYYPEGVRVNYVVSRKGETYNVMLHWYQSAKTKILSSGFQQNVQRFIGKVFTNRNDGAYVQVSSLSSQDQVEQVIKDLETFGMHVLELIPTYWPEEK